MAVIGLSLSDTHLEHVADAQTEHEMWPSILDIFELHTMRNLLSARRKFYTATMLHREGILSFTNLIRHLTSMLKSMRGLVDYK